MHPRCVHFTSAIYTVPLCLRPGLGVFGFSGSESLRSKDNSTGNFGIQEQLMACRSSRKKRLLHAMLAVSLDHQDHEQTQRKTCTLLLKILFLSVVLAEWLAEGHRVGCGRSATSADVCFLMSKSFVAGRSRQKDRHLLDSIIPFWPRCSSADPLLESWNPDNTTRSSPAIWNRPRRSWETGTLQCMGPCFSC